MPGRLLKKFWSISGNEVQESRGASWSLICEFTTGSGILTKEVDPTALDWVEKFPHGSEPKGKNKEEWL